MQVSISGFKYIDCVSAACLEQDGHDLMGVDIKPLKAKLLASGRSPIVELGLSESDR